MIKLVAFDLDGTIADTIPICIEAFRNAVSPYAGHTLSESEIVQTFGLNEIGMIKAVIKDDALEDKRQKALQDFYIQYEKLHHKCNAPFDGIVDLILCLKKQGKIVSLITGKGEKSCELTLKHLNISGLFLDILTGSAKRNCKADCLKALMEKYGLAPEECLYVGDAVSDVVASKDAGVQCLSVIYGKNAQVSKLNDVNKGHVYSSVSELKNALTNN